MRLVPILAALVFGFAGCSSSSGAPADGGGDVGGDVGAGAATEGGSAAGDDASNAVADGSSVCNTLMNSAQPVSVVQVAANPPSPQGGAPVDGTYVLTNETVYTGPGGATGQQRTDRITIQILAGTIQVAKDSSPPTSTYMLTTSGTTYRAIGACPPMVGSLEGSFTATPTTFVVSIAAGSGDGGATSVVQTFTKN